MSTDTFVDGAPEVPEMMLPSLGDDPALNAQDREFIRDLVHNEFYYRREFLDRLKHPQRDIYTDCGWRPDTEMTAENFKKLYERFPIASRIVDLPVEESWRSTPEVFETDEADDETEFEKAWSELNKQLRGEDNWFHDLEGSPVWDTLERFDKMSRIGHYGVLFLEFDDVGSPMEGGSEKTWSDPAPGFPEDRSDADIMQDQRTMNAPPKDDEEEDEEDDDESDEEGTESEARGEDAASAGEEETEEAEGEEAQGEDKGSSVKLLSIRVFDETLAKISAYETDPMHPRAGMPKEYTLTLTNEESGTSNQPTHGVITKDVKVHWSRVIHLPCVMISSEVIGMPACKPVANMLMDLEKIYGASGEGYWRNAFPGLSFESHPQLGGKARLDTDAIKQQIQRYQHTMQRYLATSGGQVKLLTGQVADPGPHIESDIEAICIYLGCPVRIFKGSERGELASTQDKDSWDERMVRRQNKLITPRIIVPFVNRLIKVGVLPEPESFSVRWQDVTSLGAQLKADIAVKMTQAITAYISGGGDALMQPLDFLVEIIGLEEEHAREILDAAVEHINEANPEADDITVPGQKVDDPFAMEFDEEGNPIPPEEQEVDEDGNPIPPEEGEEDMEDEEEGDEEEDEPKGKFPFKKKAKKSKKPFPPRR